MSMGLQATQVTLVICATCGTAYDENFIKMVTLPIKRIWGFMEAFRLHIKTWGLNEKNTN